MRLSLTFLIRTRNLAWVIAVLITILTAIALLHDKPPPVPTKLQERFDPNLLGVQTVDAAVALIRRDSQNNSPEELSATADQFVRDRFFHSYSAFRPQQNWSAWILGQFWWHLNAPVQPDEILKFRRAACSQQAIVFMAIMNRLGFETRAI